MRQTFIVVPLGFAVQTAAEPVALVADRLIDGRADDAIDNAVVLVDDGVIKAIGTRDIIPDGTTVIELSGATLMPGMIDAHAHPLMTGSDYQYAHISQSSACHQRALYLE